MLHIIIPLKCDSLWIVFIVRLQYCRARRIANDGKQWWCNFMDDDDKLAEWHFSRQNAMLLIAAKKKKKIRRRIEWEKFLNQPRISHNKREPTKYRWTLCVCLPNIHTKYFWQTFSLCHSSLILCVYAHAPLQLTESIYLIRMVRHSCVILIVCES